MIDKPTPMVAGPIGTARASNSLSDAIEHMVQQNMEIDLARIMAVRAAIADGQYPVDPTNIAKKILLTDNAKKPTL